MTGDGGPIATPDSYFVEQWGRSDDPWAHGTRWYETRKYALTAAAAPRPRYRRGFEPGCGAGFLTAMLARRVDRLISMEREPQGVSAARRRCVELPGVEVIEGRVPHDWPGGTFDLVVLSELLYYLDDGDLELVITRTRSCLALGGHVVAVHYRRAVEAHARPGDEVHELLRSSLTSAGIRHVEPDFVLDVFSA